MDMRRELQPRGTSRVASFIAPRLPGPTIACQYRYPYLPLSRIEVNVALLSVIPESFARRHRVMPIDRHGSVVTVASNCDLDDAVLAVMQRLAGGTILCFYSAPDELDAALAANYGAARAWTQTAHNPAAGSGELPPPADCASRIGIPPLDLNRFTPVPDVVPLIPRHIAMRYQVLAIAAMRRRLTLAMVDPFNILAADDIHEITGLDIAPVLCTHDDFCQRFEAFYSFKVAIEEIAGEALDPVPGISFAARQPQEIDLNEVLAASGSSSVIRTVNCMLRHAVMVRASDIHIEPQSKTTSLRFRVDGVLQEESPPPFQMHNAIVSRIKVMSEMDIAERRRPQDGRFRAQVEGREIDFRVSCLPTGYGEKIVIRVLDTLALKGFSLDTLGFHARGLEEFRRAASAPHGMIIMTGPTGSGKSTSLYMALREINKPGINIVTVVDPIEYEIEGINQVAARPEIGLTFAAGLRSILRQDPNVIMIGEIRDYETAEIAVKAALTGHLVFSTLHTNDAAGAITRLIDMGVEPYLLSSSLRFVAAQRLARRICAKCGREAHVSEDELGGMVGPRSNVAGTPSLREGAGCPACMHTGFSGRFALIEALTVDDAISALISARVPANEIKRAAVRDGMKTLRMVGLEKAFEGLTTIGEILRVTPED